MYTFVLDVDGILTNGKFLYDVNGKAYKEFGPDDADALKLLKRYVNIVFVSQDKRGFAISKKRIEDMGFELKEVASKDRAKFIEENFGLENAIYMGDSFIDVPTLKKVKYGISTNDSSPMAKEVSSYITGSNGGERAVAEACFWILRRVLNMSTVELYEGEMISTYYWS